MATNMEMVWNFSQTEIGTKEFILTENLRVMGFIFGIMDQFIEDNLKMGWGLVSETGNMENRNIKETT